MSAFDRFGAHVEPPEALDVCPACGAELETAFRCERCLWRPGEDPDAPDREEDC